MLHCKVKYRMLSSTVYVFHVPTNVIIAKQIRKYRTLLTFKTRLCKHTDGLSPNIPIPTENSEMKITGILPSYFYAIKFLPCTPKMLESQPILHTQQSISGKNILHVMTFTAFRITTVKFYETNKAQCSPF
jgi:hypothetical protein